MIAPELFPSFGRDVNLSAEPADEGDLEWCASDEEGDSDESWADDEDAAVDPGQLHDAALAGVEGERAQSPPCRSHGVGPHGVEAHGIAVEVDEQIPRRPKQDVRRSPSSYPRYSYCS